MDLSTKVIVALGVALLGWALIMAANGRQPDIVYVDNSRVIEQTVVKPVETRTVVEREVQVVQPLEHGADCVGVAGSQDNYFELKCVRRPQ